MPGRIKPQLKLSLEKINKKEKRRKKEEKNKKVK
jgi:hypothetical protein